MISYDIHKSGRDALREGTEERSLIDYYRCPEDFTEIALAGELSREAGFFQFGSGTLGYGRCHAGMPAQNSSGWLFDASSAVEIDGQVVYLPFHLAEVVDNLRRECYVSESTWQAMRLLRAIRHDIYYAVRPWMPVSVRKHLQRLYLRGWHRLSFPQWPLDHSVDTILENSLILCMKAKGVSAVPFIWFWPEGAPSCAVMTHDVEASTGLQFCGELMDLDESFDIRSSFQIVPENRYPVSLEFLAKLRSRGFEVNLQDLNHDGALFKDREEFFRRAGRINEYMSRFGCQGFRSAMLYRNAQWLEAIDASYDMSFPNVAHLEPQRGGCCTVMPYFIGRVLELPVTTIEDYSLFHILGESSIDIWKTQIDLIRQKKGLISFIVHPDYITKDREKDLYKSLLSELCRLRTKGALWIALPGEIDQWWRARNSMKLVFQSGRWRIEGEGNQRARIAFAVLEDNRLTYTFDNPN